MLISLFIFDTFIIKEEEFGNIQQRKEVQVLLCDGGGATLDVDWGLLAIFHLSLYRLIPLTVQTHPFTVGNHHNTVAKMKILSVNPTLLSKLPPIQAKRQKPTKNDPA
ncbi:hypothetical protein B4U37_03705 [Sutcliffiella horikoshii]|uniref:Uncharacterized protein n=1 Tax=Sutcliffiella horikoshii TaxID=79883 RepID=A0ABN4ZAB6_9BACI|nr:hypothetical protein B4U37_03705 [Sutcliffiella horikoshii]